MVAGVTVGNLVAWSHPNVREGERCHPLCVREKRNTDECPPQGTELHVVGRGQRSPRPRALQPPPPARSGAFTTEAEELVLTCVDETREGLRP